jgi:serine/threonine protein kinase
VDKRSDVWAFGAVIYEMLTGAKAFDSEDVTEVIAAVLKDPPNWRSPPTFRPISSPHRSMSREESELADRRHRGRAILARGECGAHARVHRPCRGGASSVAVRHETRSVGLASLFLMTTFSVSFLHFRETPQRPHSIRVQVGAPEKASMSRSRSPDRGGSHQA